MKGELRERGWDMLARINATQIGKTGLRLAALLAGLQLPVAVAKVESHSAVADISQNAICGGETAVHVAITLGQTAWSMLDACIVGQMVHAAGDLVACDSFLNPAQTIAAIVGHEVLTHLVSFAVQIFS